MQISVSLGEKEQGFTVHNEGQDCWFTVKSFMAHVITAFATDVSSKSQI